MMKWIAILLLVVPAVAAAETAVEFHLCSPYVEKSAVGEKTVHGWPVFIMLTELGATSLENVTGANVGRVIHVVVGDREFLRARSVVPIPGGRLLGVFSSQDVAMAWQRVLAGELPAAPCGAGGTEMLNE